MINVTKISDAGQAFAYYSEKDDYYLSDKMAAEWHGHGAAALGLAGEIDPRDFRDALAGKVHGQQRVGSEGFKEVRQPDGTTKKVPLHGPGWDVTLSAPKSVSVAALVGGDRRVIDAWDRAVRAGVDYIESNAALTRQRNAGGEYTYRNTGTLVAGLVRHASNRNLDPQLHTHAVVANMTRDPVTGEWRSLDSRQGLYKLQVATNNVVMNQLASELRDLGYNVSEWTVRDNDAVSFELADVSPEIRAAFSTRKAEIDAELAAHGMTRADASAEARETATLDTRSPKEHVPAAELRAQWRHRAEVVGYNPTTRPTPPDAPSHSDRAGPAADAVGAAIAHLAARDTRFTHTAVMQQARIAAHGRACDADLEAAIAEAKAVGDLLDRRTEQDAPGNRRETVAGYTTSTGIAIERAMLRHAAAIAESGRAKPRIGERIAGEQTVTDIAAAIHAQEERTGYAFTAEQREAVYGLMGSDSGLGILQGLAGTAKTTTVLASISDRAKAAGWRVEALAPTHSAARTLGDAIGADAQTVAAKINRFQPDAAAGKAPPTGRLWIVDEAGMASAKDKSDLLARAAAEDARVILVGDDGQIGSVGAGAAFKQIKDAHRDETYELTDIKRQTSAQLRAAVYDAIRGDASAALEKVEVHEHKGQVEAAEAVADDYMKHVGEGKSTLVVTLSRADRADVNAAIHERRVQAGEVTNVHAVTTLQGKGWTDAQRADASRYQPGDVIEAQRDFRGGPKRGELATVTKVEDGKVTVERSGGKEWTFDPKRTNRFSVMEQNETRMGEGDRIIAKGAIAASDSKGEAVQIKNGTEMTVDRMHDDGRIDVRYDDDKRATIDASRGVRADLGYAQTANQAQGKTVDVVIADMRSTQRKLADQQRAYVALSRAKETAIVHTDSKEKLAEQIERHSGRKETAMDRSDGRNVRPESGTERGAEPQSTKRMQGQGRGNAEHDRGARNLRSPEQRRGRVAQSGERRRGIAASIRAAGHQVGEAVKDYRARAPERRAAKAEKRDADFLRKGAKKIDRRIDKRTRKAEKRIQKAYGTNPKAGRIAQFFETGRKAKGRKAMKRVQAGHAKAKASLATAVLQAQARQKFREFEQAHKAQQERRAPIRGRSTGPRLG